MQFVCGIDIGGTFTDLVVRPMDDGADVRQYKVFTERDLSKSTLSAIEVASADFGLEPRAFLEGVEHFFLGSTVALNTLLTRSGSRVGIVTTKGHGDTYHLAQMARGGVRDLRDAVTQNFQPLVPRSRIAEIEERVDCFGNVLIGVDDQQATSVVRQLVEEQGCDALVICFLWSSAFPDHEKHVKELARGLYPDLFITASSDLTRLLDEFSRTATSVVNAYVGKRVETYCRELSTKLAEAGLSTPLLIMQSTGGLAPVEDVADKAVNLIGSGPAGGVMAAQNIWANRGSGNGHGAKRPSPGAIAVDMGGTSFDVALIPQGEIQLTTDMRIARHPLLIPAIDVNSVGAGGGSIAAVETTAAGSILRVGPESAGAVPGPACYGRGGLVPTVTDANVVLGLINPDYFAGGYVALDRDAAAEAMRKVAEPLGMSIEDAARGVISVVDAVMGDAIKDVSIRRGYDAREFSMIAYGGAGGLHAANIARNLGISELVVPNLAGTLSAYGLTTADILYTYQLTDQSITVAPPPPWGNGVPGQLFSKSAVEYIEQLFGNVERTLNESLAAQSIPPEQRVFQRSVDVRYQGQMLRLPISLPSGALSPAILEGVVAQWEEKFRRIYGAGAAWPQGGMELMNYYVTGTGKINKANAGGSNGTAKTSAEPVETRAVYLEEWTDVPVYRMKALAPGAEVTGPAIVEDPMTTVFLGEGDRGSISESGALGITVAEKA
ncbi:hydantoinase/oxoprolinase family protein [Amycolatopsis acidiphila]|uniref:Hydantoinase/oxoprolinase family protein n=1 Tax=Amycolatopsis acidiphila TaxID=715473 RepID=A0A558AI18_9PSEU|nr:hydantoinase/oxoprolinase family protein [Amycolatopsis acidiphila]TVT23897.1 hydantoinase/oxoprolinase family protein [Amycolatopsis acidiphila]UIJ61125.1 hydantoinase/oxoprolinase family protein [Amycolatopsis acidiphila]GHG86568.1 5-oxoprolinase [Amycolatopsis acidiphila]